MKKIEFRNRDIKEVYQDLINRYPGLRSIIYDLLEDKVPIRIIDYLHVLNETLLLLKKDEETIRIKINSIERKISVKKDDNSYWIIYDLYAGSRITPRSYLYESSNRLRTVSQKVLSEFANQTLMYYDLNENNNRNHYTIIVSNKEELISDFPKKLLSFDGEYNTIRDLFMVIIQIIDINQVDVKISDNLGSLISTQDGQITNYVEVLNNDENYKKIYLQDGEFFGERSINEKYDDALTLYVKKIGVRDGKEKR